MIFYILAVLLISTLIRSTFGFGESLVAVPLLAFVMPLNVAVPFSVIISLVIALVIVIQDHRQIHFNSAKYLTLYAILGLPLGIALLLYGNDSLVKAGLGLLIILYSLYSLISKNSFKLKNDNKLWLFACGFVSGIFGGGYGLNGPPLVLYGDLRQWSAKHFRATLQAYYLPISLISIGGYGYKGLLTSQVFNYSLTSLIVVIPAIFLGRYLNHKLEKKNFIKYIYIGLIIIGLTLLSDLLS